MHKQDQRNRSLVQQLGYHFYLYLYGISDKPAGALPDQKLSRETNEWNKQAIADQLSRLHDFRVVNRESNVSVSESNNEWNKRALKVLVKP